MSDSSQKLIRVGGPLRRVTLTMKPCQPIEGPIADGPLIRVGHPMQRVTVEMKPVSTPYLQLTFGVNPDLGLTPETVCAKVGRIAELVRGSGFGYDLLNEPAPGQMAVQFLPTSAEAILRLTWLQEKLPPVIADIREVTGPEWTVIPAA